MSRTTRRIVMLTFAATALAVAHADGATAWKSFYDEAPAIRIIDPMANLVGSAVDGNNVLIIHLSDVALYSGHVCPNVAAAYVATHMALKKLYPTATPVRGQIRVAGGAPNGALDLASYVTGARAFYGRHEINGGDLVVDPTLTPAKQGQSVLVFQRKDTGRAVRVIIDKSTLITADQGKRFHVFQDRVLAGTATEQEKSSNWLQIQSIVKTALFAPPEGMVQITELDGYNFPAPEAGAQVPAHSHH